MPMASIGDLPRCGCGSPHGKDPRVPPYGDRQLPYRPAPASPAPRVPKVPHRAPGRFVTRLESAAEAAVSAELGSEAAMLGPRLLYTWQAARKWAQRVGWNHAAGYDCALLADKGCSELVEDLQALGYLTPHILPQRDDEACANPSDIGNSTTLAEGLARLRSDETLGAISCPLQLTRRGGAMQVDYARECSWRRRAGYAAFEKCIPAERVAAELRAADDLLTQQKAAEARWRALAWLCCLNDPDSGIETAIAALNWAIRIDSEAVGCWGRFSQGLLVEQPELGFCSPSEFRPQQPQTLWRALLVPWADETCVRRYSKGRAALWAEWTLMTADPEFQTLFNSPRPGELVPVIFHLSVPAYNPISFRLWDLRGISPSPELREMLLPPWTVVIPDEDPARDSNGIWHVRLRGAGQLLPGPDYAVATVVVCDDAARLRALAAEAWGGCMPQWHWRPARGGSVWRRVPGTAQALALFGDPEEAAEWMLQSAAAVGGELVYRLLCTEQLAPTLLESYFFGPAAEPAAAAPVEAMLLLPDGATEITVDISRLGAVQATSEADVAGRFLRREHYCVASGEWVELRDAPAPELNAVWYCWRRVGKTGTVYGDTGTVARGAVSGRGLQERDVELEQPIRGAGAWARVLDAGLIPMAPVS
eukprot:TRINITY_DN14516_c0_g1_i1.p1 TRINITY_DN14516_c0_g1~~TRINITY_DN14516_c0_g1_i1.p1  ORF type:complete len:650 (+),score=145.17 TRINITY_DN14516_c0_g1_i1:88-2037(+)